jgi:hypothetical protein
MKVLWKEITDPSADLSDLAIPVYNPRRECVEWHFAQPPVVSRGDVAGIIEFTTEKGTIAFDVDEDE